MFKRAQIEGVEAKTNNKANLTKRGKILERNVEQMSK
jgi:hypothetical protein